MRLFISSYTRKVHLKLLALFSILLVFSWIISILIADSSPSVVILSIIAIILFVVIFFNPQAGLLLLLFVIPFDDILPYSIYKIISIVFFISWLARKSITKEQIHFPVKSPHAKYLVGLLFAVSLSLVFSIDKVASLRFFQSFILLTAFCIFLVDSMQSPKHLRNLGWAVGLSGGLAGVLGLMQYYVFHGGVLQSSQSLGLIQKYKGIGIKAEGIRVAGLTGNPNYFAIDLVVSVCFLLYCYSTTRNLILRILIIGLMGCATVSIFFTLSRGGLSALVLAMVIYCIRLKGLKFTGIFLLLVLSLALIVGLKFAPPVVYDRLVNLTFHEQDDSRESRVRVMKSTIDMFLEHPNILLTGVGLNNFEKVSLDKRDPHNIFLQMLAETGLIGFTFFLLLAFVSYRDIWHGVKLKQVELQLFCLAAFSAFTAILFQGLFNTLTYVKYIWLFFALVPILSNLKRKGYAPT